MSHGWLGLLIHPGFLLAETDHQPSRRCKNTQEGKQPQTIAESYTFVQITTRIIHSLPIIP